MGGNAAVVAMSGPTELLDTIGGEVVFEIFAYVAIVVALMNMFLVGRHTRADEETGRAELIRSARVGRHAPLAAALGLAGLANLAVAVVVFAAAAGTGLPVGGSVLLGAGGRRRRADLRRADRGRRAGVREPPGRLRSRRPPSSAPPSCCGPPATSATGPCPGCPRSAGASAPSPTPATGGGRCCCRSRSRRCWSRSRSRCWTGATSAPGCCRPGRDGPRASRALGSPLGLAWRLQRGSLIGWAIGLFLLGAAYGSFADSIEQYVADNPEIAEFLPGGAADVVNAYLALTMLMCRPARGGVRGRPAPCGRAPRRPPGGPSRCWPPRPAGWAWLGSHLTVALAGSALVLVAAGLGRGPGVRR